jgi:hypothetical protein
MKNCNGTPAEGQAPHSPTELNGKSEPQGNRETEKRRDRVSENQRNREIETQTILTTQKIPLLASRVATLPQAVEISLQGGFHANSIFVFCRALKAFEVTNKVKLPAQELEGAFAQWWNSAQPLLPDAPDFDEYRFEFQRIFAKTRTLLGSNPLAEAIRMAESAPLPPQAKPYQSPRIKRLIAVCFHLQSMAGNAPFFLSVRDAAKIVGVKKPETGASFLNGLVSDGILAIVQKGKPDGNRATRYRFDAGSNLQTPTASA